jgi:hypothetical protein
MSKLNERIVKLCLADYLSHDNLLNSFQSAYIKSDSAENTLLSVYDYLIKATNLQQVTCLTILDLSVAVDTMDNSILLERLSSWFDITPILLYLG